MNKKTFILDTEIKNLEKNVNKLEKHNRSNAINKHQKYLKKMSRCEKKLKYYKKVVDNPLDFGNLLEDLESYDEEDLSNDHEKFTQYIERLRELKDKFEDEEFKFDDLIKNYVEAISMINWCNKHISAQKMEWEVVDK